ncbi:hypothetical protein ACIOG7_24470 [Streptomyces sp. NPDC087894]|uniref:hypothetical protein n=1 Tax=Streptomyces sp. NPDC087894 TaxID=3365816 RepID=UPI00380FFD34
MGPATAAPRPLEHPAGQQELDVRRVSGRQGRDGHQSDATQERPAVAERVPQPAGEQQKAS